MSSTCFEPEGSSSGRRLYIQLWHGVFYTHQYKQPSRYKSIEHTLLPTRLLIPMHAEHTIPKLHIQPSSWRRTLSFETCRRHQNQKI